MAKTILAVLHMLMIGMTAQAGPAVEITESTFNFGKTVQSSILTHDFWIKSVGDEDLLITEVVPGCGCTKSFLADSVIAPGDSSRLHIIFSTGKFVGHVNKRPYIRTNATDERTYMKLYAEFPTDPEAVRPVMITPPVVDVSQFGEQQRRRSRTMIQSRVDTDLNIRVADSSLKSFRIEAPDKIKAGASAEVLITVLKEAVETEFEESFTIEFDDMDRSVFSIPVKRMYHVKNKEDQSDKK